MTYRNHSTYSVIATGSLSQGTVDSEGLDVHWMNTQVVSEGTVTTSSGGNTKLKGAAIKGQQVIAEVGANLSIESVQDTSEFKSIQKNVSVSASVHMGAGAVSGGLNRSKESVSGRYVSVNEQSGIESGEGGFQIQVKGKTDLIGGQIVSNEAGFENNRLSTDTLTYREVQNRAEVDVHSRGFQGSSDMITQGKYGVTKEIVTNALAHSNKKNNIRGVTKSTISTANMTVQTNPEIINTLNRDATTANQTVEKYDIEAIQEIVHANRAIQDQALKTATILTDEAYRSRFEKAATLIKGICPGKADCVNNPDKLKWVIITEKEMKAAPAGSVLVTNGILNGEKRAVELAYQNIKTTGPAGENKKDKPQEFYLMHIAPANNVVSELLGVAYEKITASSDYRLANFLGYTTGQETYAALLAARENKATESLGHSRGTLTQEAAFTILKNRGNDSGETYTNSNLSVRAVGGAANEESFIDKSVGIQGPKGDKEKISFTYFENDPVSVVIGGNKGVWNLKDLWEVFTSDNSMHSCYGTGAAGCQQVEAPAPGGPQGSFGGSKKSIQNKATNKLQKS